ncbi:MAG: hypothetical protein A4E32_02159 [Methanomassiliicoccales archaeon PtaU1.Bin124]|nr:MAG: hypothetical protein A4E32_02159 [Methanomassiliicoccales archaeon PtaU1.Bin124]
MDFITKVADRLELREVEGACGICHAVLEAVHECGGEASAFEDPMGVEAMIRDDRGHLIGEGFDIVWSPALLAAEIEAGLIPDDVARKLKREGLSSEQDIASQAAMYGYGRVLTPGALALAYVQELGGRTIIKREGLGVKAEMFGPDGKLLAWSPTSYCPTCAIAKAAVRNKDIKEHIAEKLAGSVNTGRRKWQRRLENRYSVKGGATRVSILEADTYLAKDVLACCIAYGTTKAEVAAGLIVGESAQRFKAYCNLCPMKHCWMEKPMGATGNIVLHRLAETNTEIEVKADGLIVASIPGKDGSIEGRGTLCSLSALTNMWLRADGVQVLKPSKAIRFPEIKQ